MSKKQRRMRRDCVYYAVICFLSGVCIGMSISTMLQILNASIALASLATIWIVVSEYDETNDEPINTTEK